MAHLHVKRTVYKGGLHVGQGSAQARIEYITRQTKTSLAPGAKQLSYIAGDREDLIYTNYRNFPIWAGGNPHTYFAAAEQYEEKTHVAFTEWKVTLPRELTHAQNLKLTRDIVETMAGRSLPVVYALHDPKAIDGRQQPHLHILISTRKTDTKSRTPQQHFGRYNAVVPGAEKEQAYWHRGMVKAWRDTLSDLVNIHLEACGKQERVNPETLTKQGINRQPEPKMKPSDSAKHKKGVTNKTIQKVIDIRASRDRQAELLAVQTLWNSRKAQLGITASMTTQERVQIAREARQALVTQTPAQAQAVRLMLRQTERQSAYEAHLARKDEERQNERRHSQYWHEQAQAKRGLTPVGRIFDRGQGR